MKVGDLVTFPNSVAAPQTGIVLRTEPAIKTGVPKSFKRVEVYWIEDAESSWEPIKWLKVINPS